MDNSGRTRLGAAALLVGAGIAVCTALAHGSCLILGPECFKAQMAPPDLVQSAIDGTWLAPIATIFVCSLFLSCAVFALSAAGVLGRLPFLGTAMYAIAAICIVRGIATIPLSLMFPDKVSSFSLGAGLVWFVAGWLYLFGYRYGAVQGEHRG